MKVGSKWLDAVKIGSSFVDRGYLGDDIVWPPDHYPLTLPGTVAWWTAAVPWSMTVVGGKVTSWKDRVAQHELTQATGSLQPAYQATGFNGEPGILFNNTYMEMASSPWPINALSSIMLVVCDQLSPTSEAVSTLVAYGNTAIDQRKIQKIVSGGGNHGGLALGNGYTEDNFIQSRIDFTGRHSVVAYFGDVSSTANLDHSVYSGVSSLALRTATGRTRIGADAAASPTEFCNAIIRDVIIVDVAVMGANDLINYENWAYDRGLH